MASLDKLSGGRFDFGVGIGWLAEEFAAVGVPWERRAERTREYLKAMKRLWTEEEPEFKGEFCSFPKVCSYPKPVQKPHPPIIFGGESAAAVKRVADLGDGWQPGSMPLEVLRERISQLKELMAQKGRDFSRLSIAMVGSPAELKQNPELLSQLSKLGVGQMILAFSEANAQDTISQLEDFARAVVKE